MATGFFTISHPQDHRRKQSNITLELYKTGGLLDKIKGLKMEEETDIKYERNGDMLISSSGRKASKFSIDKSKFNFWSLFDKEFTS